jgi:hypothetical protein
LDALAYAIGQECERCESQSEHALIRLAISSSYLSNGLRHCSVNVECGAGCGWFIETFGGEAEELEQKARAAQAIMSDPNRDISNSEIAFMVSPRVASSFLHENPTLKMPLAGSPAAADNFQS